MKPGLNIVDDALPNLMNKGDSSCTYQIGAKVKKKLIEKGDVTPIGTTGRVTGNIKKDGVEAYLVLFSGRDVETFILGYKLEKDDENL